MENDLHEKASHQRNRYFRYSIASSLVSKVITAAVQIIALPIAALSLGVHGFSLYAMLIAAVGWLALSNLGIGPTLVVRLAASNVHRNFEEENHIFSSAFFSTLFVSTVVSVFAILAVWTLPVQNVFGQLYVDDLLTIRWGLTVLIALFLLQSNLSLFESAQAGYQQQYLQNLFAAASGVPCILAIWIVAKHYPTPVNLILAINLPLVLFRLINVVWVMFRHQHLIPSLSSFRWFLCKDLVRNGVTFSLAGGIGNFLAHIFPVILVGRSFSADISAAFAATMNAIILVSGVLSMLSTPLWPAIADSVARGEREWARKAYRRLLYAVMTFAILVNLFFAVLGGWLFNLWFKGQINPSQGLLLAAGFYFVFLCWESAHFTILVGLHKIGMVSRLVFVRAVLGVLITISFIKMGNETVPFIAMITAIIIIDLIPMRRFVLRSLLS